MSPRVPRYELLGADELRPHEEVDPDRADELADRIRRDGYVEAPIVVETRHHVILDGHHRFEALRRLGCRRIPVYLVDYDSPKIHVTLWDDASIDDVDKEDVLDRGTSKRRFPPKTTRHVFEEDLPTRQVPLPELR